MTSRRGPEEEDDRDVKYSTRAADWLLIVCLAPLAVVALVIAVRVGQLAWQSAVNAP